ncbi:MAG: L,D-transpeptidase family protein [Clostridiales bacterium]|nr:L,D-transpeptidase family protein [Clostridiales bacterium]
MTRLNKLGKFIVLILSIILIYLIISIYFTNHYFFNTVINGIDLSLKAYDDSEDVIKNNLKGYGLTLIERDGTTDRIDGQDIGLEYNNENGISTIYQSQKAIFWIRSLFKQQCYYISDLFRYDSLQMDDAISKLHCLNREIEEAENVSFKYFQGSYQVIEEKYGNRVMKFVLSKEIKKSILKGDKSLDLEERQCYIKPGYTLSSDKTWQTLNLLNKYISSKITYLFGNQEETLSGNIINQWIRVDGNLDPIIDENEVRIYIKGLAKQYDTVGKTRKFKASTGKIVEIKGGLYGWKINQPEEAKALLENIKNGQVIKKEPIYLQRAFSREGNEIGDTYVEINITKQYMWFYKEGKLIAKGAVVTGNPNRGHATVVGAYMLNYKQEGATLRGPGYEAGVKYWMPFYGNIGLHDASWRSHFGGEIYKRNGSHGCVNAPTYLAKIIFEHIEPDTPIICYEEE